MTRPAARGDRSRARRVIVVGAGVAGLLTAHELATRGQPVLLISRDPAARARSGLGRDGIAAVVAPGPSGDGLERHLAESLAAGGHAAPPAAVRAMVAAAPELVARLDRLGVPFARTEAGALRRFAQGGGTAARTLLAGADTGRQVLGVLDDQIRRWETVAAVDAQGLRVPGEPLVRRLEGWDLVALVRDDNGVVVGVVALDRRTGRCRALPGEAVCLATGSAAGLFVPMFHAATGSGSGMAIAWRAGAALASPEAVAWHPCAVSRHDGGFALAEGLRGEGARVWLAGASANDSSPGDLPEREREYALEQRATDGGGGQSRAVAARLLAELGVGAPGEANARPAWVSLDTLAPERLDLRLGALLEAIGVRREPSGRWRPLRVFPRLHDTLGGLWVDHETTSRGVLVDDSPRQHATNLAGLYAVGACQSLYHGAGLLGGNALLACLFGATRAASAIVSYRNALARSALELPSSVFDGAETAGDEAHAALLRRGEPHPEVSHFALQRALATTLTGAFAPAATEADLGLARAAVTRLTEAARGARVPDASSGPNPSAEQARHLEHLLTLAPVVLAAHARASAPPATGAPRQRTLTLADGESTRFVDGLTYNCAGVAVTVTGELVDAEGAGHGG